jgi:uncharacterized protein YeaO (DUF488 family)
MKILAANQRGTVTLLFAAWDLEHNNTIALKLYLEHYLSSEK